MASRDRHIPCLVCRYRPGSHCRVSLAALNGAAEAWLRNPGLLKGRLFAVFFYGCAAR